MPAAPVGSILEFTVVGELAGQTIMSVFHYRVKTASTKLTPQLEQDAFILDVWGLGAGDFRAEYNACLPGNYSSKFVRAQFIWPARQRASQDVTADTGARGGAPMPNVAAVITKKTSLAGRSQIGSLHIPTGSDEDIVEGELVIGFKTDLEVLATNLVGDKVVIDGGGVYTNVIYHREEPVDPWDDITDTVVQSTSRVMRRRTKGLGI